MSELYLWKNPLIPIDQRIEYAHAEIMRLRAAILETIEDNLHLADGNDCTLIKLKRAIDGETIEEFVNMATVEEMKQALRIAADALSISNDWNLYDVQVNPPKEWGLYAEDEDADDGWCSTQALANKLREIGA